MEPDLEPADFVALRRTALSRPAARSPSPRGVGSGTGPALGCSPGTVTSNTHHALARLRAVVERDDLAVAG